MRANTQYVLVALTLILAMQVLGFGFSSKKKREAEFKEVMSMVDARLHPRLTGLFGIRFGEQFKGELVYSSNLGFGCKVGEFVPKKQFLSFTEYAVVVPLKSDRITGVMALANYQSHNAQDEEFKRVIDILETQFEEKFVKINANVYMIKWKQTPNLYESMSMHEDATILITKLPMRTSILASDDMSAIISAWQDQKKREDDLAADALFDGNKPSDKYKQNGK